MVEERPPRRPRRKPRGLPPVVAARRQRWSWAIASVVVMVSGVTISLAAPAPQAGAEDASGPIARLGRALLAPILSPSAPDPATGVRVGSLIVKPSARVASGVASNLFAAPSHEHADLYFSVLPSVDIESDWPRNAFSLRAEGELRRYATFGREDQGNASIVGTGRVDLASNAYLLVGGGYQRLHEDRGALVPVNGIDPTPYTVTSGTAGLVIKPAPFGLRLDARVDSYGYDNVALFGGGIAEETARDRIVYALAPQLSYRLSPHYDGFVRTVVNRRQYNSTREPDGLDRSSTGYGVDVGTAFRVPGFATGEFHIGYLSQQYDTARASAIDAVDFGGNVEWHPSLATTLHVTLSRSVEESALLGSQGFLQTAVQFGAVHKLEPRLSLHGDAGYINADFAGAAGSSGIYRMKLGADYRLTRSVSAGLDYAFGYRDSNGALASYSRHIIEVRLRGAL